jgi:hypothetical protein
MSTSYVDRRNFNRLTLAALGGMMAGTVMANQQEEEGTKPDPKKKEDKKELHVCRGLNSCKGQGKSGQNRCAGMGTCHTATEIGCAQENECKGQGGCGMRPGENECKNKGQGPVPLTEEAWPTARRRFEARMRRGGKPVGEAPPGPREEAAELSRKLDMELEEELKKQEKEKQKEQPKPKPPARKS